MRSALSAPFIVLALTLYLVAPASAEFTAALSDSYLENNYQWAMYIDLQDANYYLNYSNSLLYPLSKIRVHFRQFISPNSTQPKKEPSKVYEEFWYHGSSPIGLRERHKLDCDSSVLGAIVVGKLKGNSERTNAVGNALLRLLLDLHFQQIYESAVIVPAEQYDSLIRYFQNYHFFIGTQAPAEGPQMSIRMLSYPAGRDTTLYLM